MSATDTFGRYLRTDSAYHPIPEATRFALYEHLAKLAVAARTGEAPAPELLLQHGWRQVFNATEPNGASTYLVFEKSLSPGQPARP